MADFNDLKARTLSAIVMTVIGIAAIWVGGELFNLLVVALVALMASELSTMLSARRAPYGQGEPAVDDGMGFLSLPVKRAMVHGALAGGLVAIFSGGWGMGFTAVAALVLGAVLLSFTQPRDRAIFAAYLSLILIAGFGLILIRSLNVSGLPGQGYQGVLLLVLIVIASDVGGYFGGRLLGGPKFWPRVSPKKTWSGTVVGWGLAVAVIWLALWWVDGPNLGSLSALGIVMISGIVVVLAFVGQMGDIAESAIKRYCGVKDSSNLIPGHGGFLDRFDAVIAVAAVTGLFVLFFSNSPVAP